MEIKINIEMSKFRKSYKPTQIADCKKKINFLYNEREKQKKYKQKSNTLENLVNPHE